ncbi:carbohydrate ABC transporter permease [Amycolatopsis umgeniensis]|uniref:Cellobiose transport system permease protein n=1 Tax=Amycolatopsis umgeniensis TaxID=336628 RepID=A0A841AYF2_9PSEU|nr:sugar ABC transporter permease [Amycolatopsis umgeniensis]MBB5851118.1 cellobiose transport system permease protein [Amycolatopsis umgeniensis]
MRRTGERLAGYLMTAPFYVLFGVFGLFPLLYTAWVALHHWHLINGDTGFTGLGNFAVLLQDAHFYNALFNTVSIFVLSTVPQLLAALGLAALLDRPLRARTLWRASVLLPNVVSVVAVALVFSQLFAEDYGVVNWALGLVGLDPVDWRSDRFASHVAVSVMVMWRWTGYNALLYLAAMQSVPQERYDAAMLDGASRWRTFWSITVPAIRPTIAFTVVVSTIGGLQLFAEPQLFDDTGTNGTGGADRQFQTLAMYLYEKGFGEFDAGYAAAIAWLLFLFSAGFALFNFSLVRRMRGGE